MSLWLMPDPLVLASKSRSRHALLEAAGIPVEVVPADIDERAVEAEAVIAGPGEVAGLLAREKALAVAARMPGRLVVGADQTLALGTQRFSKPSDQASARRQLLALRGHIHELYSGFALARDTAVLGADVTIARLTMRAFSDQSLDAYLAAAGATVLHSIG